MKSKFGINKKWEIQVPSFFVFKTEKLQTTNFINEDYYIFRGCKLNIYGKEQRPINNGNELVENTLVIDFSALAENEFVEKYVVLVNRTRDFNRWIMHRSQRLSSRDKSEGL